MRFVRRLMYVLRKRQAEADLAEEMALHRALSGDAKSFGSAALAQNRSRDVWIPAWLQDLAQDIRFGARLLAKDRRFTSAAVVALALGIAATNTVFTFINAALFKPLPFDQPHQIVAAGTRDAQGREYPVSYPDFLDWQQSARSFAAMGAYAQNAMTLGPMRDDDRAPERVPGAYVSANTFELLRARPLFGRGLQSDDDRAGAPPVVVLGEEVWRGRYGSDPAIVGRTIRVNDVPLVVVGVMPVRFGFPFTAEVWAPLATMPGLATSTRAARTLGVVGRLRDGVTAAQAQAELAAIAERLAHDYPETNRGIVPTLAPPFDAIRRQTSSMLMVLFGAVLFVLLIACANVATLLLARAARRSREIAVRVSLGATRWRIVRQLMVESVLVAIGGGAGGLLLSLYGIRYFGTAFDAREVAAPERLATPYWVDLSLDVRIFAFVAIACLGSAMLFGLVPALHISKTDTNDALKDGSHTTGSVRANRWNDALMILELALTVVLLAGGGLLLRSFITDYATNLVVDTKGLLTARVALPAQSYGTPAARRAFVHRLEESFSGGPVAVTVASDVPLGTLGGGPIRDVEIEGRTRPSDAALPKVFYVYVGRDYLRTIGLSLVEGRDFNRGDDGPGPLGAIVSRAFAERWFPGTSAIGARIRVAAPSAPTTAPGVAAASRPWLAIVGVVPTLPRFAPRELMDPPMVYAPMDAEPEPGRFLSIVARGAMPAYLREQVRAVDPDLALYSIMTVDESLAIRRMGLRMIASLFGLLAAIALTLSSVGLFALTAHSVAQRTQEIGVRMALGAQLSEVVWLFLRRTSIHLTIGLALGLAGALAVGPVLRSVLERTDPRDPLTLAAIALVLAVVTTVASALPARRVARIDPVVALRHE